MVRLGVISYLNTRPLVYALERRLIPHRFELIYDLPAVCASKLASGAIDLGIIPAIEYARAAGYRIVPHVAIAAEGPVKSVLLFSRVPIDRVRSVALDTSSCTSSALVRILLGRRYGLRGGFLDAAPDLDSMLLAADAAVLIGDRALHQHRPDLLVYDLGELWLEETGLPFVFAVWAGPKGLRQDDVDALMASKEIGLKSIDRIAAGFAEENPMPASFYAEYLRRNVRYDLAEREIQGMRTFFRYAAEMGLIVRDPEIRFFP